MSQSVFYDSISAIKIENNTSKKVTDYTLVSRKTNTDGIGNVLKGYISALSITENAFIQNNPEYELGDYASVFDEKHIFNNNPTKPVQYYYTFRFALLKGEEYIQENIENEYSAKVHESGIGNHLFDSYYCLDKVIDLNYDNEKVHPIVRNRILENFKKITFKPIILEYVNQAYELFKNKNALGVSIRTWKASHEKNINRKYDPEIYKEKIKEVLNLHKEIDTIVLSIDNEEYLSDYKDFFTNLNISCLYIKYPTEVNKLQESVIKILLLGKCKYMIGNRISTFTELVYWLSECKVKVYSVFN
jgi:hypothetical protein